MYQALEETVRKVNINSISVALGVWTAQFNALFTFNDNVFQHQMV